MSYIPFGIRVALLIGLVGTCAAISPSFAKFQVIAFEGASIGSGDEIGALHSGLINANGRVAFTGTDSHVQDTIAVAVPEPAHFIARGNQQAPGLAVGVTFDSFETFDEFDFNALGQVAFHASLDGPGIDFDNDEGIWAGSPGDLKPIVRDGDLLPGAGSGRIDWIQEYDLGGDGYVAVRADLDDFRSGIWAGTAGNLQLVAIEGQAAPGFPGKEFKVFGHPPADISINSSNRLAFVGIAENLLESHEVVWTGTPGNLQVVARQDMQPPGFLNGSRLLYFTNSPQINDADEIAFSAGIDEPGAPFVQDTLYLKTISGLAPLYDPLSQPPGFGTGNDFGLVVGFHLGGEGKIVFQNTIFPEDEEPQDALFAYTDGDLRLVAKVGDQIPGVAGDLHYSHFSNHYINEHGHVAFFAAVSGDEPQEGLWIDTGDGEPLEIARLGAPLEIAPGDVRIVDNIYLVDVSYRNPQLSPFNDAGQLVFMAQFEDERLLLRYSPLSLLGDYNGDSIVDAADYVVWRDHLGTNANLPNDETPGTVDASDYAVWKSHFGQSAGGGSVSEWGHVAAPEPAFSIQVIVGTLAAALARSNRMPPEN